MFKKMVMYLISNYLQVFIVKSQYSCVGRKSTIHSTIQYLAVKSTVPYSVQYSTKHCTGQYYTLYSTVPYSVEYITTQNLVLLTWSISVPTSPGWLLCGTLRAIIHLTLILTCPELVKVEAVLHWNQATTLKL